MFDDALSNIYIIASGGFMTIGGRNSSWPKFKAVCRNLPEEPKGTSGTKSLPWPRFVPGIR